MTDVVDGGDVDRASHGRYDDPLDLIWTTCVARLGLELRRSDEVYASWDGRRVLTVSTPDHLDPDDSLAQLLLHELCHALVQGRGNRHRVDWGLDNTDDHASAVAEHACHRLQAALLDLYGLRALLAVTTSWRPYWDALPADPLAACDDPALPLAREAWPEACRGPWAGPLHEALEATARLAEAVRSWAPEGSLWHLTRPRTPVGLAARGDETCATCTWQDDGRCLAARDVPVPVDPAWPACLRWEPRLTVADCRTCGACCREGFHVVGVEPDEPLATLRPDLLVTAADATWIPRPGGRCAALAPGEPHTCTIYADRPRACRDFPLGGDACLEARRRVGISRA
ncbi:MAG: YkgJ family cysteine cluster protein [Alphaproteobacteria bacterium]|nr:YkgJ family cysteine cluster protein [Alphaproteobacteria bacterium]